MVYGIGHKVKKLLYKKAQQSAGGFEPRISLSGEGQGEESV